MNPSDNKKSNNRKMKYLILFTGFILMGWLANAQIMSLDSIQLVSQSNLNLSKPHWSPDGKSILATGENNSGLYQINTETKKAQSLTDQQGSGTNSFWLGNEKVGFIRKNKLETLDLNGLKSAVPDDTIILLNSREKRIELLDVHSGERKTITQTKGYFYHPVLSPDKTMAVVHLGSEMYVYKTDGSGDFLKIGTGLANCWTPDSKNILYFLDKSADGHSISNSDLYSIDCTGNNKQQITFTEVVWEMWPDITRDGSKIAFADQKTGRIYTANIRMEKK
jgi:Tol biopolymer transport system component